VNKAKQYLWWIVGCVLATLSLYAAVLLQDAGGKPEILPDPAAVAQVGISIVMPASPTPTALADASTCVDVAADVAP